MSTHVFIKGDGREWVYVVCFTNTLGDGRGHCSQDELIQQGQADLEMKWQRLHDMRDAFKPPVDPEDVKGTLQ